MIEKFDFMENFEKFRLCLCNNDRYGQWYYTYVSYKCDQSLKTPELDSIKSMAFYTRVVVDVLYNMNYYFETVGEYQMAEEALYMKGNIQNNFRNMVKLLQISKPQFN